MGALILVFIYDLFSMCIGTVQPIQTLTYIYIDKYIISSEPNHDKIYRIESLIISSHSYIKINKYNIDFVGYLLLHVMT